MSAHDGRYAPSPTGPLHIGNLRTALLAWLFARSQQARFVLRIEDLDPLRSHLEYARSAIADLRRLGLDWDGEPLRQSEHRERHREAFEELRRAGRVYACWCSRAEVRLASQAPHDKAGGGYAGTCRELSGNARRARERSGPPRAWRLDARGERAAFTDLIHGAQSATVDDFVLWRGDDVPAYNLAVVVDDADERIGEVVRGDDLLATTPRQVLLAKLLSLAVPRYVHVPLIVGKDGKRVAKRDAEATRTPAIEREPLEQLVGWMASSLGLAEHGASLSAAALLAQFDSSRLRREPTALEA